MLYFVNITCFETSELWKDIDLVSDETLLLDVIDDIDFCDDIDIAEDDISLEAVMWDDEDICFEDAICLEEEEEDWKEDDCMEEDCIAEDFMEDTWLNPLDSSLNDSIFDSWFACEKLRAPPRCW